MFQRGEVARFWSMSPDTMDRMSANRYRRYLDHYLDYLDIQAEAYEKAKRG